VNILLERHNVTLPTVLPAPFRATKENSCCCRLEFTTFCSWHDIVLSAY